MKLNTGKFLATIMLVIAVLISIRCDDEITPIDYDRPHWVFGKVTYPNGITPIVNVEVILKNENTIKTDSTDQNGEYKFIKILQGNYILEAKYDEKHTEKIDTIKLGDSDLEHDVVLGKKYLEYLAYCSPLVSHPFPTIIESAFVGDNYDIIKIVTAFFDIAAPGIDSGNVHIYKIPNNIFWSNGNCDTLSSEFISNNLTPFYQMYIPNKDSSLSIPIDLFLELTENSPNGFFFAYESMTSSILYPVCITRNPGEYNWGCPFERGFNIEYK